jgi:glutamyl-tRNA reductase
MELLVLGLSHKTAPVAIREKFALSEEAVPQAAERARTVPGCHETFLVSTCNRIELYAACENGAALEEALGTVMAEVGGANPGAVRPHLYAHTGPQAIKHLFRVAASLDSLVVGESQILGQLKAAYESCRQGGQTGPVLHRAMERAFTVAKRVRSETGIGRSSVSVASVAADLARQIFGDLATCNVLLVGAGKMGELAARHFKTHGARELLVANRNFDRARALAESLGGHPRSLDELETLLSQAEVVVTSTGAPTHIITTAMVKRALKARKYRPIFFIDIAVPRNIEPAINSMDNVYLYDVDDLSGIANENLAGRKREAEAAELLVANEAERFLKDLAGSSVTPTLQALRRKADELKAGELERAMRKLGDLDEKQRKTVEMLADGVVNKLLHEVFSSLKEAARTDHGDEMADTVRKLFGLNEPEK